MEVTANSICGEDSCLKEAFENTKNNVVVILFEGDSLGGRNKLRWGNFVRKPCGKFAGDSRLTNFADVRVHLKETTVSLGKKSRLEKPN